MPVLAMFYGIIIKMYFLQAEHNPPHIHALYGEDSVSVNFQTGEVIDGHLPARAQAMVNEWVALHRDELMEMWKKQEFRRIEPLP